MARSEYNPQSAISSKKRRDLIPSVWTIMRSHVNDNTPSYLYWFSRIMTASIFSFCIIEVIDYIF